MSGARFDGDAVIFNTSGNIPLFRNLIDRQNAKKAAEQKALADQLAQVKTDGLRNDADRKQFFTQYQDLKNTAVNANNEKDPWKRTQLKADIDQKILKLNDYANQSKQQGVLEKQFAAAGLAHHDNWSDDAYAKHNASMQLAVNDPNVIKDYNSLERQVDGAKMDKSFLDLDKSLVGKSKWQTPTHKNATEGNKTGVYEYNHREATPVEQMAAYGLKYDAEPDTRKFLQTQYKDLFANNDPQTAKALAIKDYAEKRRAQGLLSEDPTPKFKENWRSRKWETGDGSAADKNAATYRQQNISGILNGDKQAIEKTQAYLPQGSVIDHIASDKVPGLSKGGYNVVRIHIPKTTKKVEGIETEIPSYNEEISLAKGDAMNRLNAILNQYSGEKISPSKLNIQAGKPRGNQIEITAPAKTKVSEPTTSTFQVDGKVYNIPKDKESSFLNHFKNAKKIK